jgi:UDP-GlcNAc3NAcA epimerase
MTGQMMIELEKTVLIEKPDCMLLYGDTNSTLAGALVASKLHIPIAHIEAGERSFNRKMPEEINRVITDNLSSFHFVTSLNAQNNLLKEGISAEKISLVGDVMYDLAIKITNTLKNNEDFKMQDWAGKNIILPSNFVLVTVHRAENTDNPEYLLTIFEALFKVQTEIPVLLVLHPRTKLALQKSDLLDTVLEKITVIKPIGYQEMAQLLKMADLVITDSGGVQKEAYYHKKLCITLRTETEWRELCEVGWNKVVPPHDVQQITREIDKALNLDIDQLSYPMLYGDGTAAQKITAVLNKAFGIL